MAAGRSSGGVHLVALTPAGGVLAGEGRKLIERAERVVTRVRTEAEGEPLWIGEAPSLARPTLERFAQLHPRVRVRLADCSSVEMRDGLMAGSARWW